MTIKRKAMTCCLVVVASCTIVAGLWSVLAKRQSVARINQTEPVPHVVSFEHRIDDLLFPGGGRMWKIGIELPTQYYSRDNLERLFRFYSRKHPNQRDPLTVEVLTDHTITARARQLASGSAAEAPADASFSRDFTHVVLGGECNEWFYYRPDLDKPNWDREVVLRGTIGLAKRHIIDAFRVEHNSLSIKVDTYELLRGEPRGVYYSFENAENSLIVTVRLDKQVPIPRSQIRFVNDNAAYVFMGWKFAATADGGRTWSVWNAEVDLPQWRCCDEDLIEDVSIAPSGNGKMLLRPQGRLKEQVVLVTGDYGLHWNRSNP